MAADFTLAWTDRERGRVEEPLSAREAERLMVLGSGLPDPDYVSNDERDDDPAA